RGELRVAAACGGDLVLAAPAVLAEAADAVRDLVTRRDDGAAVAERRQVLGRVETERRGVAERAGTAAVAPGARCLGTVLDERDAAVGAEDGDRLDLGHEAVEVRGDDGPRVRAERGLGRGAREAPP